MTLEMSVRGFILELFEGLLLLFDHVSFHLHTHPFGSLQMLDTECDSVPRSQAERNVSRPFSRVNSLACEEIGNTITPQMLSIKIMD